MLTTQTISVRDMIRNYKSVSNRVKKAGNPIIIVSQKKPQFALVSLTDLHVLQEAKGRKSTQALLDLAGSIPKGSGLPKDLSENHDKYTWD